MLDRIDLPQGTLDLLILRTLAQRHPGKSVGRTYSSILQDSGEDVKVVQVPVLLLINSRLILPGRAKVPSLAKNSSNPGLANQWSVGGRGYRTDCPGPNLRKS